MTFGQRVTGVLKLQAATFEEIEADKSATGQALAVVIIASIAAGLGAGLLLGPVGLVRETLAALIGWVMWAGVTYLIGARLIPEPGTRTDMGELLRVIGFSYAPNVFAFFAFIPWLGYVVRVVVAFWLLAATIIAVRQALDYRSTARAAAVVLIGWLLFVIVQAVV
jgi:Yip1 domain